MPTLYADYAPASQQQSPSALLARIEHRTMLVAFVQGVVRPFHKHFRPLDKRCGKETCEGADEDFLEEGGVHPFFESSGGAREATLLINHHIIFVSGTGVAEFPVMADATGLKPKEIDVDNLSRLLELELIQKRATWKQSGERYRSIRAASFVFLFVLIVGCLLGGYFAFMRMNGTRPNQPNAATSSVPDR